MNDGAWLAEHDKARENLSAAQDEHSAALIAESQARVYDGVGLVSKDSAAMQRLSQAKASIGRAAAELEAVDAKRFQYGAYGPNDDVDENGLYPEEVAGAGPKVVDIFRQIMAEINSPKA